MDAPRPEPSAGPDGGAVDLVVDPDARAVGAAVRARLDAGHRVAGFVGTADDPAVAELLTDVLR